MTDREPFRTRIKVRHYELDSLGHLNHAVYHSYGEVSRIELFAAAGDAGLRAENVAPVLLESHIVYRRELRAGDVVDVTCDARFADGKVFWMTSRILKLDGTLSAEITCTVGLMDLEARRLVDDPRGRFERAGLDLKVLSTGE
ncbi:acyl-CoA thioesterase [Amycolatopsis rhabdoformis]|uniref:Acyl-CoA thioesterase n=1 Tax=Amycolatopsis rhabdoformis TaxID=1448059 RepID=A0ABZ1I5E6_9PSEU|nr:acyl-CoA thioesterase [Amycolatopsis rhabdoformis]WSE29623.1 acyl-CoA thioesterase [Amycolatopsis rhabdoformis]